MGSKREKERVSELKRWAGIKSASSWAALWLHPLWVWQMVAMETHVEIMLIGWNDSDSSADFDEPPLLLPVVIPKYPHTHTSIQLRCS